MMRAALLWMALAGAAGAQELPALFDVVRVSGDDVLNIRAEPSPQAEILGSLAPETTGVEVTALSADKGWGRLNVADAVGWVSMAYLAVHADTGQPLPQRFACFGNEPFWRVDAVQQGVTTVTMPGESDRSFATQTLLRSGNRRDTFGLTGYGLALILRREQCSDGMSDRLYGLSVDLVLPGPARLLSGCCTLQAGR
ncbi:SH3 domain-containing protein [Puniceibacterium confluentis]|nr:SH3 domain-containing protein [Puniceibacterium confluentis]